MRSTKRDRPRPGSAEAGTLLAAADDLRALAEIVRARAWELKGADGPPAPRPGWAWDRLDNLCERLPRLLNEPAMVDGVGPGAVRVLEEQFLDEPPEADPPPKWATRAFQRAAASCYRIEPFGDATEGVARRLEKIAYLFRCYARPDCCPASERDFRWVYSVVPSQPDPWQGHPDGPAVGRGSLFEELPDTLPGDLPVTTPFQAAEAFRSLAALPGADGVQVGRLWPASAADRRCGRAAWFEVAGGRSCRMAVRPAAMSPLMAVCPVAAVNPGGAGRRDGEPHSPVREHWTERGFVRLLIAGTVPPDDAPRVRWPGWTLAHGPGGVLREGATNPHDRPLTVSLLAAAEDARVYICGGPRPGASNVWATAAGIAFRSTGLPQSGDPAAAWAAAVIDWAEGGGAEVARDHLGTWLADPWTAAAAFCRSLKGYRVPNEYGPVTLAQAAVLFERSDRAVRKWAKGEAPDGKGSESVRLAHGVTPASVFIDPHRLPPDVKPLFPGWKVDLEEKARQRAARRKRRAARNRERS